MGRRPLSLFLWPVQVAPAPWSPARTAYEISFSADSVVEEQLFPRLNPSQAHQPDVAASDLGIEIRFATVVDEFSATATNGPIQRMLVIQSKDVKLRPQSAAADLIEPNSLTGIFNHPAARGNAFVGEYPPTVNAGFGVAQGKPARIGLQFRYAIRPSGQHDFPHECG